MIFHYTIIFILLLHSPIVYSIFARNNVNNVTEVDVTEETESLPLGDGLVVLHNYGNAVLLGGRNSAFNVSIPTLRLLNRYDWSTSSETRKECEMILTSECDNFIRTFYTLSNDHFVLCGTHGLKPKCAQFSNSIQGPSDHFSGEGLSPFIQTQKAPFVHHNDELFIVNAAEYSTSSDAILLRKNTQQESKKSKILRTARGESVFDQADFIGMERNDQELYTFFTELSSETEGCGLRRTSRLGRICMDDPGSIRHKDEWSSFVKLRLECGITEDNHESFMFNQLSSIGSTQTAFYGAFRSKLAGLGASAICIFPRQALQSNISSVFGKASRSGSCARATDIEKQASLRSNSLTNSVLYEKPQLEHYGKEHFTALTVEQNVQDLNGNHFDVLYLGTNLGSIFKVIVNQKTGKMKHVTTLSSKKSTLPIKSIWTFRRNLANNQFTTQLIASSDQNLFIFPSSGCSSIRPCGRCLQTSDPQCAWITNGDDCVNIQQNMHRKAVLTQSMTACEQEESLRLVKKGLAQQTKPCMCEKREACTTQVIQKNISTSSSETLLLLSIFAFMIGLLLSSFLHYVIPKLTRYVSQRKKGEKDLQAAPIAAYSRTTGSTRMTNSSHLCMQTYC